MVEVRHPAKFSKELMPTLASSLLGCKTVLDPFAGTGRIHNLAELVKGLETFGVELEPEWAEQHERTIVGDALNLPYANNSFDAICTSPTYGNRMADHHEAKDNSRRNTYRHALGRPLSPGNSGTLQWGDEYREFHYKAWAEAIRVLRSGGRFILNIKDHYRDGAVMLVTQWHIDTLQALGLTLGAKTKIETPGNRQGANAHLRVDHEWVILFIKPQPGLIFDLGEALKDRATGFTYAHTAPFRSGSTRREGRRIPRKEFR